jgi:hypothetical protein
LAFWARFGFWGGVKSTAEIVGLDSRTESRVHPSSNCQFSPHPYGVLSSQVEDECLVIHRVSFVNSGALNASLDDAACLNIVKSSDRIAVTKGD